LLIAIHLWKLDLPLTFVCLCNILHKPFIIPASKSTCDTKRIHIVLQIEKRLGGELKMYANYQDLKPAAAYYSFRKAVQGKGTVNIILGILGIVSGFLWSLYSLINMILILLGIILLAIGIWARIKPTANSLLFSGIALCIMGAWNAVVTVLNILSFAIDPYTGGVGFTIGGLFWAIVQLSLAVEVFNRYRKVTNSQINVFDDEWLKKVENAVKPVINANPKNEDDVIEFRMQGMLTNPIWKGKLTNPFGIIVSKSRDDIFIVTPNDVNVEDQGRFRLTKFRKADLTIDGRTYRGMMPPESVTRLQYWKNPTKVVRT
jgi:hypothetical protein